MSARQPDLVVVRTGDRVVTGHRHGDAWSADGVLVETVDRPDGLRVEVEAEAVVSVALTWPHELAAECLVLRDAWERTYGEAGWGRLDAERVLPWYWLATDGERTVGMGVDVQPAAFCSWTVNAQAATLVLDLSNGGHPTRLGGRRFTAAVVRTFEGEDPWATLQDATRAMAAAIERPAMEPVVGANNWYYAYGQDFDEAAVLGDARTIVELADGHAVRPWSVIDDGWNDDGATNSSPWVGHPSLFPDMAATAARIKDAGARPGLWFRPLLTSDDALAEAVRAPWTSAGHGGHGTAYLDPSHPATIAEVQGALRRFADWGFELVKHDFSTFDTIGTFNPSRMDMAPEGARAFHDRTRTTAEILVGLYRAIREAAPDLVILGCNTVGHLAAGLEHLQRTGDDTSGRDWATTRRMGVNTLAFRLPQQSFFVVDADCVPATPETPWEKNRQWLDVVARSGTALFCSIDPRSRTPEVDADLAAALRVALDGGEPGLRPLDWLQTPTPEQWRSDAGDCRYTWD